MNSAEHHRIKTPASVGDFESPTETFAVILALAEMHPTGSIPSCFLIGQLVRNKKNKYAVDDFDNDKSYPRGWGIHLNESLGQ